MLRSCVGTIKLEAYCEQMFTSMSLRAADEAPFEHGRFVGKGMSFFQDPSHRTFCNVGVNSECRGK